MKLAFVLVVAAALVAARAHAQAPVEVLDLSLPAAQPATAASSPERAFDAPAAFDPPGKYYGDTSGRTTRSGSLGDQQPGDDGEPQVWGSVSTGIGYSKGYGNSHWSAADINVSKAFGEGGRNRVDLHINVEQSEGPGFGRYHPGIHGFDQAYDRQRLPPPR